MFDLTDHRFGKLKVVRQTNERRDQSVVWLCRCDCGKEHRVSSRHLRSGKSWRCWECAQRSGPCFPRKNGKWSGDKKDRLFAEYRRGAERRGYEFCLNKEQAFYLFDSACHYCGLLSAQNPRGFSGIDRANNEIGYTEKNCVPCCAECNYKKARGSYADFLAWIDRIAAFRARTAVLSGKGRD